MMNGSSCTLSPMVLATVATAAKAGGNSNTDANGVVLGGYDVVAYFAPDMAMEGRSDLAAEYELHRQAYCTWPIPE